MAFDEPDERKEKIAEKRENRREEAEDFSVCDDGCTRRDDFRCQKTDGKQG